MEERKKGRKKDRKEGRKTGCNNAWMKGLYDERQGNTDEREEGSEGGRKD